MGKFRGKSQILVFIHNKLEIFYISLGNIELKHYYIYNVLLR